MYTTTAAHNVTIFNLLNARALFAARSIMAVRLLTR
jgi:hypothetical protein